LPIEAPTVVIVFEPTIYAQLIHAAIREYQGGNYERSADLWTEVLRRNLNYDLAYTGIGRALLRQDRFAEAMANFRLGSNREQYSEAFGLYRREVMSENFGQSGFSALSYCRSYLGIGCRLKIKPRFGRGRSGSTALCVGSQTPGLL
jgi:tetratricopeptide (TPR) repeat protein